MSFPESPYKRYAQERNELCMVKPRTHALVKTVLLGCLMGIPVVTSIVEGRGAPVVISFIFALLLLAGVEIKEIEVMNSLYILFNDYNGKDKDENGEED